MLRVDAAVALTTSQSFSNMQNDQIVELNENQNETAMNQIRRMRIELFEYEILSMNCARRGSLAAIECKTRILTWHTSSNSNRVCSNNCNN